MSKRSRALYEADLQAQQSPYVAFGSALPPIDPSVRDDGSYVPVWKQEVRDAQGRRRLHGAFTGGWSAGYYNTVGSKEGWTPSSFVSSRTNRHKDSPHAAQGFRPEDYMDEEDLADAEEARTIHTSGGFVGLGLTADDTSRPGPGSGDLLAGLFGGARGDTMGTKLLKKMGWKEGQGIGPKVRRSARLDVGGSRADGKPTKSGTYLFAPENVAMIRLVKKTDHKGLGFQGEGRLGSTASRGDANSDDDDRSDDDADRADRDDNGITRGLFSRSKFLGGKTKGKSARTGGIGLGVLNDTGSDDEDPYDMGPRISFNRAIGGDKKKKKSKHASSLRDNSEAGDRSTVVKPKVVFSRSSGLGRGAARVCHDGRPPLQGFVLGKRADALTADASTSSKYPPPVIPPGWKSSKQPRGDAATASAGTQVQADGAYRSMADAAKASTLNPKARAAVLGEAQLPGKSVFDFLSPEARDRIAAATGRQDLPEARSEIPAEYALSEQEKRDQLLQAVPSLDKATAVAAITRGARGGGPYQDNEAKRSRYRAYLEFQAGIAPALPPKPAGMKDDDWLREAHEFFNCARIFKPMSGLMASRFTTSTSASSSAMSTAAAAADGDKAANLVTRPAPKVQDPAEEAAKMGMYGPVTRTVGEFFPTRLLCKRMGVKPPDIVHPDVDANVGSGYGHGQSSSSPWTKTSHSSSSSSAAAPPPTTTRSNQSSESAAPQSAPAADAIADAAAAVPIQPGHNEALEGKRAGEDVFRAVFGDSDDDDD
ncbi:G patch domain-containing protein 1 [Sporothrix schenckii 1099-18]|uniref:G patch domain-containing protein 1 n=1 Tax=Sporothrix schenckii 1099-18 TaxID=1397361 RepID=A0A0F2MAJ8_SPOSC|nr:G patch domain-containing protein 1 [Sporothrix schenckii 1099-18]KJR85186.1 G patch domain-containing protein 1 [Sporothrix schenckii 1099-18]